MEKIYEIKKTAVTNGMGSLKRRVRIENHHFAVLGKG